jgi:hypothetical protein
MILAAPSTDLDHAQPSKAISSASSGLLAPNPSIQHEMSSTTEVQQLDSQEDNQSPQHYDHLCFYGKFEEAELYLLRLAKIHPGRADKIVGRVEANAYRIADHTTSHHDKLRSSYPALFQTAVETPFGSHMATGNREAGAIYTTRVSAEVAAYISQFSGAMYPDPTEPPIPPTNNEAQANEEKKEWYGKLYKGGEVVFRGSIIAASGMKKEGGEEGVAAMKSGPLAGGGVHEDGNGNGNGTDTGIGGVV